METYYNIGKFVVLVALFAQSLMLLLQASALRRHGNKFFLLLCLGSICGVIYALLTGLPYFLPLQAQTTLFLLKVAAFVGTLGAVLAICGTFLLFRSYRKLAEVVAATSSGGT